MNTKSILFFSAITAFIAAFALFTFVQTGHKNYFGATAHAIQWCNYYSWQPTTTAMNAAYTGGAPDIKIKTDYLP